MALSDRTVDALVTAGVGIAVVAVARWSLAQVIARYVARAETRRSPDEVARLRTRAGVLVWAVVTFLVVVFVWQLLTIFPSTRTLANTVVTSGAVLALLAGLALTVPLGNLGAGIMLALAQPVRLGDRMTIDDVTGEVEQITIIHTVLRADDGRRVYVPNSRMFATVVVNRTVDDRRRHVHVQLPVSLGTPVERAREVVLEAVRGVSAQEATVQLTEVGERAGWLTLSAVAPADADAALLGSELRERAVGALARAGFLPA
ncbi:MAG: mechanosensitive ion channel [Thermoleophilia bacterium]|nr:mechanosensitive ion channel [Thermoleophilia bacterium]